jgi:hypothetical protein
VQVGLIDDENGRPEERQQVPRWSGAVRGGDRFARGHRRKEAAHVGGHRLAAMLRVGALNKAA